MLSGCGLVCDWEQPASEFVVAPSRIPLLIQWSSLITFDGASNGFVWEKTLSILLSEEVCGTFVTEGFNGHL